MPKSDWRGRREAWIGKIVQMKTATKSLTQDFIGKRVLNFCLVL